MKLKNGTDKIKKEKNKSIDLNTNGERIKTYF